MENRRRHRRNLQSCLTNPAGGFTKYCSTSFDCGRSEIKMRMTHTFRVDRGDGQTTCFGFEEADKYLPSLRDVGLSDSDLFECSQTFKDLKAYSGVEGSWESSDPDSRPVGADIIGKIRTDFGLETKIEMFNEHRGKIVGDCYSGTFF